MKKVMFSFLIIFVVFVLFAGFTQQQEIKNALVRQWSGSAGLKALAPNDFAASVDDPVLLWNTFMGGISNDYSNGIAIDGSGNIYVTGFCNSSWGTPVNPFAGDADAFVAKMNSNGILQWHTFLGGVGFDYGYSIVIDSSGNIYLTGYSLDTWGSPVDLFADGNDAFVARLNSNGVLQWNTFLGGDYCDNGIGIVIDKSGNIYVIGESSRTWGSPLNPFAGNWDAFVARLNSNGVLQWNTFLGGSVSNGGYGIVTDGSDNILVTGRSGSTWGSPVNPYAGEDDAFVAGLDSNGVLQWNTFLGGVGHDYGNSIVIDSSGNIYVTGHSTATWGNPLNPFGGGYYNAFVARLNSHGILQWHTFLGGSKWDIGTGIATDGSGNIYVTGGSESTWGTPVNPFAGFSDVFVASLNSNGVLQWNTFLGDSSFDEGMGIATYGSRNIYVTGGSRSTWGSPVNPYAGGCSDAFVARVIDRINSRHLYRDYYCHRP